MKKQIENIDAGTPSDGQIRVSDIIAHVLKTGELFPLPSGYEPGDMFYDVPRCLVDFDAREWVSITKTDYARAHGKAPSQVSRWVKAGMPSQGGRLPYRLAEDWLELYDEANAEKRSLGWRLFEGNAEDR